MRCSFSNAPRCSFQHTAARRRLGQPLLQLMPCERVSTHSRPKAAASRLSNSSACVSFQHTAARRRLAKAMPTRQSGDEFQHTAARRRLGGGYTLPPPRRPVSTHSRPKAAGLSTDNSYLLMSVSTHSRPKAAGDLKVFDVRHGRVSTHSRPKAAGR